jgi:transcription initiation factor TFIIIB Brf1 subunit/transcription initiation factor TFIIB
MARTAIAPLGISNIAQNEYVNDLKIITVWLECVEVSAETYVDVHSGDIICESCGRVLADRILDTCTEWGSFFENYSKDTEHSARDYSTMLASNYTVNKYQPATVRGPNAQAANRQISIGKAIIYPDKDYQGNDSLSSVRDGSTTPVPGTPSTTAIAMQHVQDIGAMAARVVLTIDVTKANSYHDKLGVLINASGRYVIQHAPFNTGSTTFGSVLQKI